MFTMVAENTRRVASAMAAVAVVALGGLTLDRGHVGSMPEGSVEVGELTPINLVALAAVTLPEVVVTADRATGHAGRSAKASGPTLPALAVAAGKAVLQAESGHGRDSTPKSSVLLK